MLVEEAFHDAVAHHAGVDDLGDVLRLHSRIEDAPGPQHHDGPLLAESVAAGLDHRHLACQSAFLQRRVHSLLQRDAPGGMASRAGADADLGAGVVGQIGPGAGGYGRLESRVDARP